MSSLVLMCFRMSAWEWYRAALKEFIGWDVSARFFIGSERKPFECHSYENEFIYSLRSYVHQLRYDFSHQYDFVSICTLHLYCDQSVISRWYLRSNLDKSAHSRLISFCVRKSRTYLHGDVAKCQHNQISAEIHIHSLALTCALVCNTPKHRK